MATPFSEKSSGPSDPFIDFGIVDDSLTVEQFVRQQWEMEIKQLEEEYLQEIEQFKQTTIKQREQLEVHIKMHRSF